MGLKHVADSFSVMEWIKSVWQPCEIISQIKLFLDVTELFITMT